MFLEKTFERFITMLEYKCDHAGIVFEEINEDYTTQRCSNCQDIPDSSPKGMSALGIVAEHDGFFRTKTTQGERDD